MRIVLRKDCMGGEKLVDVELPRAVLEADLDRFRDVRSKQVFSTFPKPFFRLDVERRFLLTGVIGEALVRFTVRQNVTASAEAIALAGAAELLGP